MPLLLYWQQLHVFAPKNSRNVFNYVSQVAPIKQISVPKLELEAAVFGTNLSTLLQSKMTLNFEKVYLWTDIRVVLDWISSTKKQNVFVSKRREEIKIANKTIEWNHVLTNLI